MKMKEEEKKKKKKVVLYAVLSGLGLGLIGISGYLAFKNREKIFGGKKIEEAPKNEETPQQPKKEWSGGKKKYYGNYRRNN